jgi:hypothetical protein
MESLAFFNAYPEIEAFTAKVTGLQGSGEMAVAQGRLISR